MDKKTIYSKTGKGVLEIKNKSGKLSKDLVKVLTLIDGKSSVGDLISKSKLSDPDMDRALANLTSSGYIKEFSNTSAGVRDEPLESSYVDDLDFTASLSQGKNVYQSAQTEWRQRESTDRAKAEQEAKKKREDEDRLKKERELKQAKEEAAKLAKVEAERKSKEAAALKQREELERKSKIEADLMAQTQRDLGKILEAERKALEQSERKKQEEMSAQAKQDAERRSREDAERRRKEEDERKRHEEEEKRRDEEARKRKEEEERKRKEEEERKRKEEEERKRKEEEERKRREEEERKRKEEEERKRKEEEERKRKEEEERKRKEEEERTRKEEEARRQREEEERRKRREEEDRRRQEEDERRRIEDEEHRRQAETPREDDQESLMRKEEDVRRQREDEERRRNEEDDASRRRDEEEVRRRDEDERREREEADRRRREEEERVSAAARSDLPELDISGLTSMETRVASEFDQQQEKLRKREEEEERQREAADQERRALERAEREEDARLEAERREAEDRERRERMEREREEREDRERKRQEEKENRIREQEERRLKADHERAREAEMKVETERRKREEDLGRRRKEQEERDRKRAEVDALKKQKAIRGPLDRFKPVIIGLVVLVAIAFGGIQLMPMNTYIPAVEKLASDHIKEPVTIGAIRLSVLGGFQMNLENVKIGLTEDVKAGSVTLSMGLGSVFAENKVIEEIEADSITVAEEVLSRLPKWKEAAAADPRLRIDRLRLNDIKLESRTLQLPALNLDLSLVADGAIGRASVSTSDGRLRVELTPRGSEVDIAVAADQGWVPAIGPAIPFTDLTAKAVASGNEIRVDEFNALFYGGAAKGSARIQWGGPWTLEGDVRIERAGLQELMSVFTNDAKSSGQLEATLRYAMSSSSLATLFDAPRVDGSFTVRKGDLDGVDLVRALQVGGRDNVQGGATRFEEISGTVGVANNRYQYRNLRLSAGLLSATGGVEIAPDKDVSGRVAVELRSQAAQMRGNFNVTGNLKAIVLRPN